MSAPEESNMDADEKTPPMRAIAPESAPPGAGVLANAIGARNLMIVIVTMPLVFLIVVMATITIVGRPGDRDEGRAKGAVHSVPADVAVLEQPAALGRGAAGAASASLLSGDPAPLALPRGAKIASMALDGDRLVLRI